MAFTTGLGRCLQASAGLGNSVGILAPLSVQTRGFGSGPKIEDDSISSFVAARVEADEYKDALRVCHQYYQREPFRWTWGELNSWSKAWSRGILDTRMRNKPNGESHRLAYSLANDSESIVTDLAAARADIPTVTLAPDASEDDFVSCFENTTPRLVLVMDQFKGDWKTAMMRRLVPELASPYFQGEILKPFRFKSIRTVLHTGMEASPGIYNFSHFMQKNPVEDPLNEVDVPANSIAFYAPFNGQWVGFKQSSVVQSAREFAKAMGLNREDRVNMNLSLADGVGKAAGVFGVFDQMSCLILPDRSFSAESTVDSVSQEVCNALMVTPGQLQEIVNVDGLSAAKVDGLQKLLVVSADGSVPSADLLTQAKSLLGVSDIRVAVGSGGALPFLASGSGDPLSLQALPGAQVTEEAGVLSVSGSCTYSSVYVGGKMSAEEGAHSTGVVGKVSGGKISL